MRLAARFCNAGKASGGMRLHPPGGGEGGRDGRGWHVRFAQPEACPGTRAGGDDGSFGRGTSQRVPGNKAPNCCLREGLPGVRHGASSRTASGGGRRDRVRKNFSDRVKHGRRLPRKSVRRARCIQGGNTKVQHAPSVRSVDDIGNNLEPSPSAGCRLALLSEVGRFLQLGRCIHLN